MNTPVWMSYLLTYLILFNNKNDNKLEGMQRDYFH